MRVKFETAKLAKEFGVSIGTNGSYTIYKEAYHYDGDPHHRESHEKGEIQFDHFSFVINTNPQADLSNNCYEVYEAPNQEELYKYLREKYNVKIVVSSSTKNQFGQWVQWHVSVDNFQVIDHRDGLDTYEEAFEIGLQYALKNG